MIYFRMIDYNIVNFADPVNIIFYLHHPPHQVKIYLLARAELTTP